MDKEIVEKKIDECLTKETPEEALKCLKDFYDKCEAEGTAKEVQEIIAECKNATKLARKVWHLLPP